MRGCTHPTFVKAGRRGLIWFPMLHDINVYGGVLLFMGYSAYDTHQLIKDYEKGQLDHIGHATNYLLISLSACLKLWPRLKLHENKCT
uniref:Inhibitor of apoptosis-promoting Bax1 n=1 Tax=Marseillevirus LCMAC201 TaxID=2506605 RepID=A0A481YW52_9VIRU|nr:MAG: inhibitor of apoptosis-promoting Bax1 [Marseillevirus LCMAC201]